MASRWVQTEVVTGIVVFHQAFGGDGHRIFCPVRIQDVLIVVVLIQVMVMVLVSIWTGWQHV